ncbi:deoxyribose-phosphate aldolase [Rubrimonas cliftonensis]|uniref:Deoxyribose-phosphate aldolase n=1 Tax=Rubrimonas cliftonensis TaxID=89524 RepID=A0A1H4AKZ1_9RHOB|nr:deoxyribose-phosphate aldolase [Rubrimonas cliftonensis]SEA36441.1 deoxyribose-phosphate aldolase [Rubrimonas cliftonensis]
MNPGETLPEEAGDEGRAGDAAIAAQALACLDLTELSDACDRGMVEALCARARTPHGDVAAVCVWPAYAALARELLAQDRVKVATVVNFPFGGERVDAVAQETRQAVDDGADEIDLVLPYRAFAEGRADAAAKMVHAVRVACGGSALKVILETSMLREPGLIRRAADLALDEGADFVKTSTGKVEGGATADAALAMLAAIRSAKRPVGLKVSGGVRTLADARTFIELAAAAMGETFIRPEQFRIGASGLLTALMSALDGTDADAAPESGY